MLQVEKAARQYALRLGETGPPSILQSSVRQWLDPENSLEDKPEEQKGIQKAVGKLSPVFISSFKTANEGKISETSLLLNQEIRARHFPDIRCSRSNLEQPESFWTEYREFVMSEDNPEKPWE